MRLPCIHRTHRDPRSRSLVALLLASVAVAAHAQADRHSVTARIEVGSVAPRTSAASWLDGGLGKLRYDEGDDGIGVDRLVVQYDARLRPTLTAHVVADYLDDGDGGVDVTEAYLEWRPVPKSPRRHRLKGRCVLPAAVARERGLRLAEPVLAVVVCDQQLARRGDAHVRCRVEPAAPARRIERTAARTHVRFGVRR